MMLIVDHKNPCGSASASHHARILFGGQWHGDVSPLRWIELKTQGQSLKNCSETAKLHAGSASDRRNRMRQSFMLSYAAERVVVPQSFPPGSVPEFIGQCGQMVDRDLGKMLHFFNRRHR